MRAYEENVEYNIKTLPAEIFMHDNKKKRAFAPPHYHTQLEFYYILKGTLLQKINDTSFKAGKKDLVIVNEGDIHSSSAKINEDVKIIVIKFEKDFLASYISTYAENKYIYSFLEIPKENKHFNTYLEGFSKIEEIFVNIYEESINQKKGFEITIRGYIFLLLGLLIRNNKIYVKSLNHLDSVRAKEMFRYIKEGLDKDIDLKTLSKKMNLSYYYLSKLFKKLTGKTFKAHLDYERIKKAELLLCKKDLMISQIAYEVGYNNVSSFNRAYKRIRKITPREYQKNVFRYSYQNYENTNNTKGNICEQSKYQ